jgi:hypothetical protein
MLFKRNFDVQDIQERCEENKNSETEEHLLYRRSYLGSIAQNSMFFFLLALSKFQ